VRIAPHLDAAAFREFDRIAQQIDQHLADLALIGADHQ
jgi:hypothetical protein